jgi:hypothetical protein
MSGYQPQYQTGAPVSGPGPNRSRPGILTAALAASGLAGLLVIISQVMSITTGKDLIQDSLREQLGPDLAGLAASLALVELDDAYTTLKTRGVLGIVLALIVLLFTVLALRGGIGPRVTLTIMLVLMAGLMIISVRDVFPSFGKAAGTAAIILAPVAIILMFMPAANAFAKARKTPHIA